MTHADFRRKQAEMDEAGMLTNIRTIRVKKEAIKPEGAFRTKYRYKYRYEVIANGRIVANVKSRRTAKKRLIELFEEKMSIVSI